jgi:hypothetical protein
MSTRSQRSQSRAHSRQQTFREDERRHERKVQRLVIMFIDFSHLPLWKRLGLHTERKGRASSSGQVYAGRVRPSSNGKFTTFI